MAERDPRKFETGVMYVVYRCVKHPDFETESPTEAQQHLILHITEYKENQRA
jgi:hypothetical protein